MAFTYLEVSGQEGVVDDEEDSGLGVGDLGHGLDVGDLEGGVGGRLDPDHLGVGPEGLADLLGVGGVDEGRLDLHASGHLAEVAVGTAVEVVHGHDVVAGREQMGERRGRGQPGREGHGVLGTVKSGQALLQDVAGRVTAAAVLETEGKSKICKIK